MSRQCYICNTPIVGGNKALEHIIPNYLGGKLSTNILLCRTHNSDLSFIDNLLEPLIIFANQLDIKRDRGETVDVEFQIDFKDGKAMPVMRSRKGHLFASCITKEENKDKIEFKIEILTSDNKKKNAELKRLKDDVYAAMSQFNYTEEVKDRTWREIKEKIKSNTKLIQPEQKKHCSFSEAMFPSFLKIALNFYFFNKLNAGPVNDKLEIIRDAIREKKVPSVNNIANWYFPDGYFNTKTIHHTISIFGRKEGYIYCLISLFGVANVLVLMSENYNGDDFFYSYCYDLRREEEIGGNMHHPLTLEEIKKILASDPSLAELQKAYSWFYDFFLVKSSPAQDSQVFTAIYIGAKNRLGISNDNFDAKRDEFLQLVVDHAMSHDNFKICKKNNIIDMFNMCSDVFKRGGAF